ncbi:MAG: penicillin-binding transpeptidase domain-containing protein [Myxococcota bacterium]|nr:penicillin-binding transpeptidase domain-containing protein [Myxococcota bacterium]
MRRVLFVTLAAVAAALGLALLLVRRLAWHAEAQVAARTEPTPALVQAAPRSPERDEEPTKAPQPTWVAGLDLLHIASDEQGSTAPAEAGTARLTLDPELQRTAVDLMRARHLPEAAVVLMDVSTGRLLVYASHVERAPARDLCAEATAPSASVFKLVTAAALLEHAHLGPETKQCYSGGEQRIRSLDLVEDPHRDRWCTTLAGALGRSLNTVFARLASEHLTPPQLDAMARRFGYGRAPSFDVPVQASTLRVPSDALEFARTAAGFWNTTLSPIQAAQISAMVARDGEAVRPSVVDRVLSPTGSVVWAAPGPPPVVRAIAGETAEQLATMMAHTVTDGTSRRAFHDGRGTPFLPGIAVAGKTGTLTDSDAHRYYTWFTGFAPANAGTQAQRVAIAALVVNGPTWEVKANVLGRDVLRAYFASRGVAGVTRPSVSTIARHRARQ